jgi:hypothetical protein
MDNSKRKHTRHLDTNRNSTRPDRYTPCDRAVLETRRVRSKQRRYRPDGIHPAVCRTKSYLRCNRSRTARESHRAPSEATPAASMLICWKLEGFPGGKWQIVTLFPALAIPAIAAAYANARAARHHRSCLEFLDPNMWAPPRERLSNEC